MHIKNQGGVLMDVQGEGLPAIGQLILYGIFRQAKVPACAVQLLAAD
jgi:hypothetical protein